MVQHHPWFSLIALCSPAPFLIRVEAVGVLLFARQMKVQMISAMPYCMKTLNISLVYILSGIPFKNLHKQKEHYIPMIGK